MIIARSESTTIFSHVFVDFVKKWQGYIVFSTIHGIDDNLIHVALSNFGPNATSIELLWGDYEALTCLQYVQVLPKGGNK